MLTAIMKKHSQSMDRRRELQDLSKKEAVTSINAFQSAVVDLMNVSVAMAYQNQKKLDVEVKNLQSNTAKMTKQIGDWIKLSNAFNQSLKELGDIENWAATLEADMRMISTSLEYAYNCQSADK